MAFVRNMGIWIGALALVWLLHFTVADRIDPYYFTIIMYAGINIILATSLNLVNGFTGQFSIGHAGFMSVGGYTAAYITTSLQAAHPALFGDASGAGSTLLFLAALAAGGLASAAVGYL